MTDDIKLNLFNDHKQHQLEAVSPVKGTLFNDTARLAEEVINFTMILAALKIYSSEEYEEFKKCRPYKESPLDDPTKSRVFHVHQKNYRIDTAAANSDRQSYTFDDVDNLPELR